MRDHRKLQIFGLADKLALLVFHETKLFPREEMFGLSAQMRRCAVSIPSNIVEGCTRDTTAEYMRFLTMAYGSAKELEYQASLAARLGYMQNADKVTETCQEMSRTLNACIQGLRKKISEPNDAAK
ncbi:MAG TPA: four helix bundle protein [Planctomycetota bacterium]|nr:four helix bundle protein [Planctomycetota bacterium]